MTSIQPIPLIYQPSPPFKDPTTTTPHGWTRSTAGYCYEANKLSRCLLRNRKFMKRDYTWSVSINIERPLSVPDLKQLWSKVSRKLRRRNIIALWVREPSRSNHVNYHLIVKSQVSQTSLEDTIEYSMPTRSSLPLHKHISQIQSQFHFSHYITKAKLQGSVGGKLVADKYGQKRLLFQPNLSLRKYGTIGRFREKPKRILWQEMIAIERRIAFGLENPGVRELAAHVYEMLGETVSQKQIERSFGYWSEGAGVRAWVASLFDDL